MTFVVCFVTKFLCCVTPIFGPFVPNVDKMLCVLCCVAHFQCVAKNINFQLRLIVYIPASMT